MIRELGQKNTPSEKEEVDRRVGEIGKKWSKMLDARRSGNTEELRKLAESLAREAQIIADKIKGME